MAFKGILRFIIVYLTIVILWMIMELIFYGEIQHRKVDDIITLILAISIHMNWQFISAFLLLKENIQKKP